MEDLFALRSKEGKANNDKEREGVDASNSPEPIRPRSGKMMNITSGWVDLKRIVGTGEEGHFEFCVVVLGT